MSEKQELIKRMLELQQKFMEYEREHGVTEEDYYSADEGSLLHNYREEYLELADKVVNLAHAEVGSIRD